MLQRPRDSKLNSIVVRGTNWLGDAVMSIPALRQLGALFPDTEIVLHAPAAVEDLLVKARIVDRSLTVRSDASKLRRTLGHVDDLEAEDFDLAVLFPNSFESALTTRLARIRRRIGYNKDLRGLLLTDPIPVPEWKSRRHEVYYYLNLVAAIEERFFGTRTSDVAPATPTLDIAEEDSIAARRVLARAGVEAGGPLVAIGAGSTNSNAKRWGTENFAKIADMLIDRMGAKVVLLGSPSEADASTAVINSMQGRAADMTGRTTTSEAAAILSVADLLVSNDMGLAHLAPAVGTPAAAIYGPTDPTTTRPFSQLARVIRAGVECSPCMLRECPIDHRCMTQVSPEQVFEACEELLAANGADEFDNATNATAN